MDIHISTGGSMPIYRQIIDQICRAVRTGAVGQGERLPSVRALAERLVINPNTVARTYGDLIRQGVLEGRKGKGVFVAPRRAVYTRAERIRRIQEPLDALVNQALLVGCSLQEIREALEEKLGQLETGRAGKGGHHG